jgi:hypothetical protein
MQLVATVVQAAEEADIVQATLRILEKEEMELLVKETVVEEEEGLAVILLLVAVVEALVMVAVLRQTSAQVGKAVLEPLPILLGA